MKNPMLVIVGVSLLTFGCHHSVQTDLSTKLNVGAWIEAIDGTGNSRISSETFRPGLHSRAGDPIRLPVAKTDIQYWYSLGFKEVRVDEEAGHLKKKAP